MSKNVVTLKLGSTVTQGHWKWYRSIDCVWFPISAFSVTVPKRHRKFLAPPYYSQRAVFVSPLSAFFINTAVNECSLLVATLIQRLGHLLDRERERDASARNLLPFGVFSLAFMASSCVDDKVPTPTPGCVWSICSATWRTGTSVRRPTPNTTARKRYRGWPKPA